MKARVLALRASIAGALNIALFWLDRIVEGLYAPAILMYGPVKGVVYMMIFSLVICLVLLWTYDFACTRNPTSIRSPFWRAVVEACTDILSYESIKERGAEAWSSILRPVVIKPARDFSHVRMRWHGFLAVAHSLHLGKLMRMLRMMSNLALYTTRLTLNLIMVLWEPIRSRIVAPAVLWLVRHHLEPFGRYLVVSLGTDAMTATIVMRPAHSHTMGVREWSIFFTSLALSCFGWGVIMTSFVSLAKFLVHVAG